MQQFGHNRNGPKMGEGCGPFLGRGSWVPIWHSVAFREAHLHAKCHLDPPCRLATVDMDRKSGALPPFWGGDLGLHLTQCRVGLPSYQVASRSIQPFGHNILTTADMGRKLGAVCPFGEGELGPHLAQCGQGHAYLRAKFHLDSSNRLATIHQRHTQDRTDRQRFDRIGRTVLQTVAQQVLSSS